MMVIVILWKSNNVKKIQFLYLIVDKHFILMKLNLTNIYLNINQVVVINVIVDMLQFLNGNIKNKDFVYRIIH